MGYSLHHIIFRTEMGIRNTDDGNICVWNKYRWDLVLMLWEVAITVALEIKFGSF